MLLPSTCVACTSFRSCISMATGSKKEDYALPHMRGRDMRKNAARGQQRPNSSVCHGKIPISSVSLFEASSSFTSCRQRQLAFEVETMVGMQHIHSELALPEWQTCLRAAHSHGIVVALHFLAPLQRLPGASGIAFETTRGALLLP